MKGIAVTFPRCKPGTVAGACKPNRWAVTLVDVHSLGKGVECVAIKNSDRYYPGQGFFLFFPPCYAWNPLKTNAYVC